MMYGFAFIADCDSKLVKNSIVFVSEFWFGNCLFGTKP